MEQFQFHTAVVEVGQGVKVKLRSLRESSNVDLLASIGTVLPPGEPKVDQSGETLTITWPGLELKVVHASLDGGHRYDLAWQVKGNAVRSLCDEVLMGSSHWYGCAQVRKQLWPIEAWQRPLEAYVAGDSFKDQYGGVQERYWLSSSGTAVFVEENVPLFVSMNDRQSKKLSLVSKWAGPYKNPAGVDLNLVYTIIQGRNVKEAHKMVIDNLFSKPSDIPDPLVFRYPIWSTWAQYKKDITQELVLQFAKDIKQHGFPACQVEIDDDWTPAYGDMEFDPKKFPDPKAMVDELKEMGHRVTLWVHPFASPFSKASSLTEYWLKAGMFPGYGIWWNGVAKSLDMTNPEAVTWYKDSLQSLRVKYGIDSFKFDAGEVNWFPKFPRMKEEPVNPNDYLMRYAEMAAELDTDPRSQEVRVGFRTQHLPIFVRMMDKDSNWSYDNGLKSIIPHALTFSLLGYPFILPDMIGGNAYPKTAYPEKELYIRWLQVCVFLPALQFSITPWNYDDEVIRISQKMAALHEEYSDVIIELGRQCVETGEPIIRPLWWTEPEEEVAMVIDSEFLVGDDILVAPILEQGAASRDVYLPSGRWTDIRGEILVGPGWQKQQRARLDELLYYKRVTENKDEQN